MPIPLAMMIPFMATQSMVMGEAFGKAFQFGKRRISAMSNEEFNKYTMQDMASEMFANYKQITPEIKQSIADSKEFQTFIFAHLLDMPRDLLAQLFGSVVGEPKDIPTSAPVAQIPKTGTKASDVFSTTQQFQPPIPGTSGAPSTEKRSVIHAPTAPKPTKQSLNMTVDINKAGGTPTYEKVQLQASVTWKIRFRNKGTFIVFRNWTRAITTTRYRYQGVVDYKPK